MLVRNFVPAIRPERTIHRDGMLLYALRTPERSFFKFTACFLDFENKHQKNKHQQQQLHHCKEKHSKHEDLKETNVQK